MNAFKQLTTLSILIVGLAWLSPSALADKSTPRATVRAKTKAKAKAPTPLPKVKDYDFMADEIDGDRVRPDGTSIFGIQNLQHSSLIRLRSHFIDEIMRTAEML